MDSIASSAFSFFDKENALASSLFAEGAKKS